MEKSASLPLRQEIPDDYKWRLEDIYASDAEWEQDYQLVQKMAGEVAGFAGRLGQSAGTLLEALRAQERLMQLGEKVHTYAYMRRDEDNTNPTYQALRSRAESLDTMVQVAVAFFIPEILAIPEQTLEQFLAGESDLELYRFALSELLRQKPHILSASEEQIVAQAGELAQAPANIFRMLNNADLVFPPITDEQGREVEVTHGRFIRFMESKDRRVRQEAFKSVYGSYRKLENTLAATLSSSIKRDMFYARVRNYPSALEASLFADNIPVEVYTNLIQTVRKNLPAMHRYVALRNQVLGLADLHMYDLYTPLVSDLKWEIPYPEAVKLVREGLTPLGDTYGKVMAEGFATGWIDVYENKGKTSGAYSWGPYGAHPYILMNYQENLNNVFTLAHEMGHAMHSYFSYREQPYVYAHYKIFTAEVASTVNELLLMEHLLKVVGEREKQLYLINYYLEQFRGTVFRQTMFAEFEKIVHDKVEDGEALTPGLLRETYHQLNVDYYGPQIVVDEEIGLEWARIPHFYNAFYVYKYATGYSAASALSRAILEDGDPAVARYLDFLKSGDADYPLNLLRVAGVDMASPGPVQAGLDLFASLVERMEALL